MTITKNIMKEKDELWEREAPVKLTFLINRKPVLIQQINNHFRIKIDGNYHRVYGKNQWKVEYPREYFITSKYQDNKKWKYQTRYLYEHEFPKDGERVIIKHLKEDITIQPFKDKDIIKLTLGKGHQLWTSLTFSNYYHVEKREKG